MEITTENLKTILNICGAPVYFISGTQLRELLIDTEPEYSAEIELSAEYMIDERDGMVIGKWDVERSCLVSGEIAAQRWAEITAEV